MVLNSFGTLVVLLDVSLAFHGLGDCNIEVSTEASLCIDPKKDITEVTFVPSVNLSISNVNGEPFKPDLACNHYGLFVFFVVNAKGKEIMRYPADVGSAISMTFMSSRKTAVSITFDVKQKGTCDFQYVRNKMNDIAYELLQTNTTDVSNELYMCRYNVDQTFAYTVISSTLLQLIAPYIQWNMFGTYCKDVGGKREELLSQSLVSYLIFAISIILLATFPVLAAILPECPKADLRYYSAEDVPFSFRMLLMYVIHGKTCCYRERRNDNQGENISLMNRDTDYERTEVFAHSFRYFVLLIAVLLTFNIVVHLTFHSGDTWEFLLVHETLSNAAVPLGREYWKQMCLYYGFIVLAMSILLFSYCCLKEFSRELTFKGFDFKDKTKVYVLVCEYPFAKGIDVNMFSGAKYTFHTSCLKLLENSLFSYAFWTKASKHISRCCQKKSNSVYNEHHECCTIDNFSFYCFVFIMIVINIPFVFVQSIPFMRASLVAFYKILGYGCCTECNCLCRIGTFVIYIILFGCVHVLVCGIIITSVQFVLQFIVFTFFVSVAFYPSEALPKITLILAFVKVLVEAWHEFQTDMGLVLKELYKLPELRSKSISKRAYAYVFEMINGPSMLMHCAKILFLTFTFYVSYDAVTKGGILKENWQTVFASVFLFFTPEMLVKITGMTKETKEAIINEQLELFFKNEECKKQFLEYNLHEIAGDPGKHNSSIESEIADAPFESDSV